VDAVGADHDVAREGLAFVCDYFNPAVEEVDAIYALGSEDFVFVFDLII